MPNPAPHRHRIARATALAAVAGALALAVASQARPAEPPAAPADPAAAKVSRGAYLVAIGGCNDCHTPFKMGPHGAEPDMTMMLAGHPEKLEMPPAPAPSGPWIWSGAATNTAFAGPWGISYARNLTPDKETGMGRWSEAQFVRAMRTGKHLGMESGRPILPPMPWPGVARMTDDDLSALFAYLQSVPPIKNAAPQSIPAPPPPAAPAR